MKGYGKVSVEAHVPIDGGGVQYNFALPCTSCEGLLDSAQWDQAYREEVSYCCISCMVLALLRLCTC